MVGLKSLDKNIGSVEVTTTNAADNLGKKLESTFFGGVVRERKAGISLNDTDSGKIWQIEAFGNGLGADNNINVAGLNLVVEGVEAGRFGVVGVKTSNAGSLEEFF